MLLSVVIPVFNGADFINQAYQGILNQGLDDFEILFVDNNSTDQSVSLIESLCKSDTRVRLFHQTLQGAAAARNKGIQHAKGDYVYVFDVDDEIYPGALQSMIKVLDENPGVLAVFGKMVKSYQGIDTTPKPKDETHQVILKEPPYWGLKWFSSLKEVVGPPAFLYRKDVFKTIGLYNEAINNNEDTALDIKLGMQCSIAYLDSYVYLYFKHEASTIQTSKRHMERAFMIWPRLVKEHLPFYLSQETPKRFQDLLFNQLFQSMSRQICFTQGFQSRLQLRQRLLQELRPLRAPFMIRFYLTILAVLPLEPVRKVYGYYIVPYVVKRL